MTPDNKSPLPTKIYYDTFCLLLTQTAFAFTVAPFLLLSLSASLTVWSRVYFYAVIGVIGCQAFLSSAGKAFLVKELKKRNPQQQPPGVQRMESTENVRLGSLKGGPTLGLPDDPEKEMEEIVSEVRREVEERRRKGSVVTTGDVRRAVEEKVREFRS